MNIRTSFAVGTISSIILVTITVMVTTFTTITICINIA